MIQVYHDYMGREISPDNTSTYRSRNGAWVVAIYQDHLLVNQEPATKSVWQLPGGGIDAGETAEQTVIRECCEETGLVLPPLVSFEGRFSQDMSFYAEDVQEFWDYHQSYLLCCDPSLKEIYFEGMRTNPFGEGCCCQWLDIATLEKTPLQHFHRRGIEALLSKI